MNLKNAFKKALPTILTVVSAGGVVATAVLSSKSALKAQALIKEAEESKHDGLTTFEVVQVAAPAYIPAIAAGVATIACICGVRAYDRRQQAALIGGYAIIKNAHQNYISKVKELYGEEAHQKVMDAIAVEKTDNVSITVPGFIGEASTTDFGADEDKHLFFDAFSDRYFESTIGQVLQAEMHLNRNYTRGADVTVNDFYSFLGLVPIENGNDLRWSPESGIMWIDFNHHTTVLDDGLECCVIEMVFYPEMLEDEL